MLGILASVQIASAVAAPDDKTEDVAACASRPFVFDGIAPLQFSTVGAGSQLNLHARFPSQCSAANESECKSTAYLVPGDVVAVGKSCGAWSYVQFIGEKRVSVGWVLGARLTAQAAAVSTTPAGRGYEFSLSAGKGVPVCEAYLQRLNMTPYVTAPQCDRPENGAVPGFSLLHRAPLSVEQAAHLRRWVQAFDSMQAKPDLTNPDYHIDRMRDELGTDVVHSGIVAWLYDPRVDLDNDGTSDHILVWGGNGLDSGVGLRDCGHRTSMLLAGREIAGVDARRQYIFALTADDAGIDAEKTRALTAHPQPNIADLGGGKHAALHGFKPIGRAFGIFKYRDLYYFDTFYDAQWGDFEGRRAGQRSVEDRLAVFLNRDGAIHPQCEYELKRTQVGRNRERGNE